MSTGAIILVATKNPRQPDTAALAQVQGVTIPDSEYNVQGFATPITGDVSVNPAQGVITRQITGNFTPEFMAIFPDDASRQAAMTGWLSGLLAVRVPCVIDSENVTLF